MGNRMFLNICFPLMDQLIVVKQNKTKPQHNTTQHSILCNVGPKSQSLTIMPIFFFFYNRRMSYHSVIELHKNIFLVTQWKAKIQY